MTPERTLTVLGITSLYLAVTRGAETLLRVVPALLNDNVSWPGRLYAQEFIAIASSLLLFAAGIGLLRRTPWARSAVVFYSLSLILIQSGMAVLEFLEVVVDRVRYGGSPQITGSLLVTHFVMLLYTLSRSWFPLMLLGFMSMPSILEALPAPAPVRFASPRLTTPLVLGAVCILVGAIGVLGPAVGLTHLALVQGLGQFQSRAAVWMLLRLDVGAALLLLLAGIGLVRRDYWARLVATVAAVVQLVSSGMQLLAPVLVLATVLTGSAWMDVAANTAVRVMYGATAPIPYAASGLGLALLGVIGHLPALALPVLLLVFMRAARGERPLEDEIRIRDYEQGALE